MLYNTIEIRPTINKKLRVGFEKSDIQRVRGKSSPHSLGFYHYPAKLGAEKAFRELKEKMILDYKTVIENCEREIKKIEDLEFPDWIKD